MKYRNIKFFCECPSSSGMVTAVRRIRIKKEDYATFYSLVQDYFDAEMELDEYMGLLEAEGKAFPEDLEDELSFGSLNDYFERCFVVSDVEFIEKEESGTMVYRVFCST